VKPRLHWTSPSVRQLAAAAAGGATLDAAAALQIERYDQDLARRAGLGCHRAYVTTALRH